MVEKLRCKLQKYCKSKLQVQYLKQFQSHVQSGKKLGEKSSSNIILYEVHGDGHTDSEYTTGCCLAQHLFCQGTLICPVVS